MLRVIGCLVEDHSTELAVLAGVICALASLATIKLLKHARGHEGASRAMWLAVTAVASGSGIWATHFIAMLAFDPKIPSGYDLPLTALSLLIAVAVTGAGLAVAALSRQLAPVGGAIVGVGVATMHFTGMAAFEVAGSIAWDRTLVTAAILSGASLGAASLWLASGGERTRQLGAALVLLLAICSLHFTAMGAISITPDPSAVVSTSAVPPSWLAAGVAVASLLVMLMASSAAALDLRDASRIVAERDRMRSLANAAVEGLVICRAGVIVNANENFAAMVGVPANDLAGAYLSAHFRGAGALPALSARMEAALEAELTLASGTIAPVELVIRPIGDDRDGRYAVAVRDLRARKKAEREIAFLAHHDALTGLPNRASFDRRLGESIELATANSSRLAMLYIDLDRFKEVNDLFGHQAGDNMLQSSARVISGLLGEGHMAARLGGDEFALFAPVEHALAAGRLADRILSELADARGPSGHGIMASIGIALFPDDSDDQEGLFRYADIALYRAKNDGRGIYRFFEASMGAELHDRRSMEHDLRHAMARGQLTLAFQPQAETATATIVGFEALLRWDHPGRGRISPSIFIPIAEESGSIAQIGEWVLREACREAASWTRDLSVAVNVSSIQLHSPSFPTLVHEVLLQTGLSPHRLELEITETALVRDLPRALATLRRLKAFGVRIAMDDFGTGYSSLSNLRAFPFDKIKIDRSFVKSVDRNEQTAAIVRSVLGLGRGLGLPVVAEGVETEAEMAFLASENCEGVQGYLLGRPEPIESFHHITRAADGAKPEIAHPAPKRAGPKAA